MGGEDEVAVAFVRAGLVMVAACGARGFFFILSVNLPGRPVVGMWPVCCSRRLWVRGLCWVGGWRHICCCSGGSGTKARDVVAGLGLLRQAMASLMWAQFRWNLCL